ncbi:helicase-associated domain-containing protein [Crossiella sp. CA-258035]|uniref:helicase-associated domain-containing protein n=1 Tax=Crossiella sp. CA-258035 TaxID=2981138 RepID=UPI0024BBFB0A|nr:helicase-associated domain-containing protein [Crossiella sp. CA-258035]WHT18935.1 helicase-associated domain-containing protein [Crossiella sp. CA-258035]
MKLKEYLRGLDRTALVRLFELRPDVLVEPAPRYWDGLAKALSTRTSLELALRELDQDALSITQAIQVLGPSATPAELAGTLASPRSLVTAALARLAEHALVWPTADGGLACPPRLATWWTAPLGLGAPLADLLTPCPLAEVRALTVRHGLPAEGTRATLTRRLADHLGDRSRLTRLLAGLPRPAAKLLTGLLADHPRVTLTDGELTDEDLAATAAPLLELGLLLRRGKSAAEVPREVGFALPEHRRRFRLTGPPRPATSPATPELARSQAAVAAAEAVRLTTTLLEHAEAEPIPALLSGGIGTRELRRLAKSFGCPPEHAALWLDLAYAADLLGHHRAGHHLDSYAPTAAYDDWRTQPAAHRWTTLVRTWLTLPEAPTHRQTPDGRTIPPTVPNPGPAKAQRQAILTAYAELAPDQRAADPAILAQLAWHVPMLTTTDHTRALAQATLTEARLLGLLSEDQLTEAGHALLAATASRRARAVAPEGRSPATSPAEAAPAPSPAPNSEAASRPGTAPASGTALAAGSAPDPEAALLAAATALLPATVGTARLQSDLTAIVTGDPAQHLVRLLDTVADLETNSSARVWRFSAASIRRALDTGATADGLLADLAEVAAGGVPQPLAYLVRDVARRHGSIRVVDAGCVIHTADEIQALEIMNSRPAERLGLRQVAPTVLVSPRPRPESLAQLRRAGFTPVGEDATGNEVPEAQEPRRGRAQPAPWRPEDHAATPAALAEALAEAPAVDGPLDPDRHLRYQAPDLPEPDRGWLAAAISTGGPVEISYRSPDGPASPRVVSDLTLEHGILLAWCHRHETEAQFLVERIAWARPISGPVTAGRPR